MNKTIYPVIGKEKNLPFFLTGIGISEPEYHVNRKCGLISHQILFTKSGVGIVVVGGKSYRQTAGSCFFMPPEIPHEYYPENGDWTTCWVVFRGTGIADFMKTIGFDGYISKDFPNIDTLSHIFSRIFTAAKDSVYGGESCSHLVYEYILEARRLFFDDRSSGVSGTIIENAVAYIDRNLDKDISLERLSEISNVSLQHFCRVFHRRMGMRPMEYISRKRVAAAQRLLDDNSLSVCEVGEKAGFSSLSYFGFVFRKYTGMSPTEYRRVGVSKVI